MADRVDGVLTDYFKGDLEKKIKLRVETLHTMTAIDENIGGGRAQYKYSNAVEDKLITEDEDNELIALRHNKHVIDVWTQDMDETRYKVLKAIFSKALTWDAACMTYNVSKTSIKEWRDELKSSIVGWGLLFPN